MLFYMPKYLLMLATVISFSATLYLVLANSSSTKIQTQARSSYQINLTSYLTNKGAAPEDAFLTTETNQFEGLVATAPAPAVTVLGTTSTKSAEVVDKIGGAPVKNTYTVAVLGDSMIDTLGPDLPDLKSELAGRFPGTTFKLLNYGAGATDMDRGVERLTNDYTYLGVAKKALLSTNPDIVVVESFAYNHWGNTQSDLDRQWLTITKIIDTVKRHNPQIQIVLASTLAPHCPTYTDGSANLPPERKYAQCATVKNYLQNVVNFATSQNYPLANVYHASLKGKDGDPKYINQGDHIHPSDEGKKLFAQKVAEAIVYVLSE